MPARKTVSHELESGVARAPGLAAGEEQSKRKSERQWGVQSQGPLHRGDLVLGEEVETMSAEAAVEVAVAAATNILVVEDKTSNQNAVGLVVANSDTPEQAVMAVLTIYGLRLRMAEWDSHARAARFQWVRSPCVCDDSKVPERAHTVVGGILLVEAGVVVDLQVWADQRGQIII
jgi:hypothetical protein